MAKAKGAPHGNNNAAGPHLGYGHLRKVAVSKVNLNSKFDEGINRGFATYGAYKGAHLGATAGLAVGIPGAIVGGIAGAAVGAGTAYSAGRAMDYAIGLGKYHMKNKRK